MHYTLDTFNF